MEHKFSAGKYYIGDPCYAVKDDAWGNLLDKTDYFRNDNGGFIYNGEPCFTAGTAYGDGVYEDNFGRTYGVDAGLIGIMPVGCCDGDSMPFGNVVNFDSDFCASCNNGVFEFGNVIINTMEE